jgi:urease accessory protein
MNIIRILKQTDNVSTDRPTDDELILPYDLRQKARQRVKLRSGREAGLFLPRGTTLKDGDRLSGEEGICLKVVAAEETVSIAKVTDPLRLAKIAYHIGNRHVALKVLKDRLIYLHDHVIDDMVTRLGGTVTVTRQPFEPEEGAYHGNGGHHH